MTTHPHYIPNGFHSVTPYLTVGDAAALLVFLKKAFDAEEILVMRRPDGSIGHAQVRVGDSMIEMAQTAGKWKAMRAALHFYVPDTDATYRHARAAGADSLYEPADMFYGERSAGVVDPAGNHWYISTHTEELTPDELRRRAAEQKPND
jgi:uncharacterized glyoxalase superfamily protein PhnB